MAEKCRRKGCTNTAAWIPELLLYTAPNTMPANALCAIPVCEEHKHEIIDIEYLVTDESWQQMTKVLTANRKLPPSRTLTQVRAVPISDRRVQEFLGHAKAASAPFN